MRTTRRGNGFRLTPRTALLLVTGALILTAITYLIDVSRSPDPAMSTTSSYAAFAGRATTGGEQLSAVIGGSVLVGALTTKDLRLANHTSYPTLMSDGLSSFSITLPQGAQLHATRTSIHQELSLGSFTIIHNGTSISKGVWSAVQVQDPQRAIGYEFLDNPNTGRDYSGAMVIRNSNGTLYTPDGTTIAVVSQRAGVVNSTTQGAITFTLTLEKSKTLTCIGKPLMNTAMQGMSGIFVDPMSHRTRVCNALVFS